LQGRSYWLTFPADNPIQCNPVTAPDCHFVSPLPRPLSVEAREARGACAPQALYTEIEH
jgi:hypothetical protein